MNTDNRIFTMCAVLVHVYGAVKGKATFSHTKIKRTEFLQHCVIFQTKGCSKQFFLSLELSELVQAEAFLVAEENETSCKSE